MPIIEMENVTKRFRARQGTRVLIGRGGIADWVRGKKVDTKTALDDVSFEIEQGESIGIIGANGSGKSTLLKIIAGVTVPTEGTVRVHGRVASLLELGAGFHPMLTGRENVYLNAGILGMRRRQVNAVFNEIVDFSGIGDFIEYPVATYSSGMYVRLAFSVAAHTNPDVFLIDEVLSVGDEEFQRRCQRRIGELTSEGKTMVFVSHDLGIVNSLCERVLLMSQGKMILRDSTTRAINFYLRQVGEEKGLHTMRSGSLEAIFCNGRVSLFYEQREITAASGLQFQVLNYGQWQSGLDADWDITERTETSCRARGYLAKLKLYFVWEIRLEEGEFFWKAGFECEDRLSVERYEIVLYFPMTLSRWAYDESNGSFPELLPEHTSWHQAIDPDLLCERAAILPPEAGDAEAVSLHVDDHRPNIRGSWANTDYMTGCRVLKIEEHIGEVSEGFAPGHHELLSLRLKVGGDREQLEAMLGERSQKHAISVGDLSARFDRGSIRISQGGVQITDARHVYASVQIGNLWNDSTSFRWESFRREGDTIHVEGASRRFPFKQIWEISPAEAGIGIRIWIEALEDIDIQECHTSIMIVPGYTSWSTEAEEGSFPPITREDHDWTHLNRDYAPGQFVEASGEGLPSVRLENAVSEDIPLSMTVLNSSYFENARVLQALRSPEHGARRLERGRHLFYDGCVRVK